MFSLLHMYSLGAGTLNRQQKGTSSSNSNCMKKLLLSTGRSILTSIALRNLFTAILTSPCCEITSSDVRSSKNICNRSLIKAPDFSDAKNVILGRKYMYLQVLFADWFCLLTSNLLCALNVSVFKVVKLMMFSFVGKSHLD